MAAQYPLSVDISWTLITSPWTNLKTVVEGMFFFNDAQLVEAFKEKYPQMEKIRLLSPMFGVVLHKMDPQSPIDALFETAS